MNHRPFLPRRGPRTVSAPKRGRCSGRLFPFLALAVLLVVASTIHAGERPGTLEAPIVDSRMTREQAVYRGVHRDAPDWILERQAVVEVCYRGFDGKVHQGQIVVDRGLVEDVKAVFQAALRANVPMASVIPVSHERFGWSDDRSMAANNTSGFNYRPVTGGKRLSRHALGWAVDINPLQNPYIRGQTVLPPGADYDPDRPGTLTESSPVVRTFLRLGWTWGGHWKSLKDYQHFEAPPGHAADSSRPLP